MRPGGVSTVSKKDREEQYVQIWCARLERFARPCAGQDDAWDRANGQIHEDLQTIILENREVEWYLAVQRSFRSGLPYSDIY